MCGICGVADLRGNGYQSSADVLGAMTDSMAHRGPSDRGTLLEPGVAQGTEYVARSTSVARI